MDERVLDMRARFDRLFSKRSNKGHRIIAEELINVWQHLNEKRILASDFAYDAADIGELAIVHYPQSLEPLKQYGIDLKKKGKRIQKLAMDLQNQKF